MGRRRLPQAPIVQTVPLTAGGNMGAASADAIAECVVELKGEVVDRVSLVGKSELVVGRDASADISLDDRALSRRHCRIERRGAALWLIDLGSANGTLVNGTRVEEAHRIARGDVITVGRYHLRIEGVQQARSDTPLLTLKGPEGTHRFALVGDEIIIGRSESCDIAIGHKSISRRHLKITMRSEQILVEDLKSQNGTKVNGKRIGSPTAITADDVITMGGFTMNVVRLESGDALPQESKDHTSMLIDSHEAVRTAYVDGNFDRVVSSAVGVALGSHVERDNDERSAEESEPSRK
jgi:pSer/pThr/pTyr-binding forkhead associated (FHA) protein